MVTSQKQPVVYILSSKRNGTLYIGVTSDIRTRVWQHKNDVVEGSQRNTAFTASCIMNCMKTWFRLSDERSKRKSGTVVGS
jgi:predicted GIY-YIG superfamily endonuclease